MARYTDDSRDKVRDAVDFVDLVGARVELRKAGVRRYQGLCPFHEERSPSFGIDPVEKLYHCFGCGAGGDVFKWVMELDNVGFGEALEILADRYDVTLERTEEDPGAAQRRQRRDRLHAVLERTAAYYVRLLWESGEAAGAREYLASRGLEEATAREFRVGYSPSAWDRVVVASGRAGFSAADLLEAGVAMRSSRDGQLGDRFRGRLMFPWADARGRVIGFGARALSSEQQPKYLNSSEGDMFSKGKNIYGFDLARAGAAKAGAVVLVEGYTDVLALHQAGIRHAVGQMGTALTAHQAGELAKLAPTILLCLDADSAGQNAMLKAAATVRALSNPPELRVVPLPSGSDPADVVASGGAEAVQALLAAAVPFARWQVEHHLRHGDRETSDGRERLLNDVGAVIRPLPAGILRQELVRLVAGELALSDATIVDALNRITPSAPGGNAGGRARAVTGSGARQRGASPDRGGFDPTRGGFDRSRRSHPAAPPAPVAPLEDPASAPAEAFGHGPEDADPGLDALLAADPGREGDGGSSAAAPAAAPPAPRRSSSNPALAALDRRSETELSFLALCAAFPATGTRHLAAADLDALFSSALIRRAAAHLRDHPESPAAALPPDDEPLSTLVAELVVRAGAMEEPAPAELDRARLMLDLARLERDIAAARASQDPVSELAAERQRVLSEIRKVTH